MLRKVLVLGLVCVVVAAGAVAYISDFEIGELLAPGPPAPPAKVQLPPRPAYLDKDIATLEAPLEAAITADLSSISQFQDSRRWLSETEPLIPTKDLVEGKDALQEVADYRLRIVDAYRKGTKDPKEAQKVAGVFLERYAQAAATQRGDFKAIREHGDAAIKAGSTDPFVVAYHIRAKHNLNELQPGDAYTAYKKVFDELGDGAYPPPILRFQLTAWNADLAQQTALAGVPGLLMRQLAYQEAAKFLAQESGKANPAVLLSFVQNTLRFNNSLPEQRTELYQACLSEPKIDPYIPHMLGGEYYLKLAWAARGDGYAQTVSADGWKKFGELMPRAARHFRRAWYLRPENPYAAQRMIMITRAGGDDSWLPEDWFHASLVAQFDYHEAYDSYMFISMPRWGGSHLKIASFAKDCIATGRWYTNVPNEAAHAIRLISSDSPAGELPGKNPAAEQIASAYIDGFSAAKEKGEVKPEDFADMLATMTSTLVQAENFKQARKAFDIGPESNDWWWSIDRGVGYRYSMGLSYAITGPAEESVKPVHEFLTREAVEAPSVADVEAMQKRLDDARAADSNEKAAGFYDIAGRMLGQLNAYAAGEWVDLTFDKYMTLWISRAASYDMIDKKTLRLTGKAESACMQMKPLTRFAPPFIVEAEIKMVSSASGDPKPGIVIGASQVRSRTQRALPQLLAAGPTIMGYFQHRQQKGLPSAVDFQVDPEAPGDGFQHLGVRRYVGQTDMFAMHGLLTADRNDEPANDFIMFGDLERFTGVTGEAIFRNIRVRKALLTPGLDTENPEKLPVFFEAVDYYPECPEARKQLAGALSEQGRPAEALEHIAKAKAVYRKIVDLHRIEGVALSGTGKFEPALAAFREDYRLFPHAMWSRIHEAWMLSTAPDEKLRDGRKAQEILDFVKSHLGERADAWSLRMTEAAVAAENVKFDEAKEFARQGEESADTDYRRGIAQRIRLSIDQDRAYRMPESGEIPPPPAGRPVKKKSETAPDKTRQEPTTESEPKAQ